MSPAGIKMEVFIHGLSQAMPREITVFITDGTTVNAMSSLYSKLRLKSNRSFPNALDPCGILTSWRRGVYTPRLM